MSIINQSSLNDPVNFLAVIVPSDGVKFVVEAVTKPGADHTVMHHHPCGAPEDMVVKVADIVAKGHNVYYAMSTYKEVKYKTTSNGFRYATGRTQENAHLVQSLWLDWDVGKADDATSYSTQQDALDGLKHYVKVTGLPAPIVVSSGYGFHSYWPFTEAVSATDWEEVAKLQRRVTKHIGVKVDPACDKDCARVLRVPGSFNYKPGKDPKPVKVLVSKGDVRRTPIARIKGILQNYLNDHGLGLDFNARPDWMKNAVGGVLSGHQPQQYNKSFASVAVQHCNQLKEFSETGGASEPIWWANLGLLKHCEDGQQYAHEWSAKHHDYDEDQTNAKMAAWAAGPTSCEKFKEINPKACHGCQQQCKSPISLGVAVVTPSTNWLDDMNAQYAWIDKDAGIYRIHHRDFIAPEKFHNAYANRTTPIPTNSGVREVAISRQWLKNAQRRQHPAIVTRPGEAEVTSDGSLNDWAGFSVEAIPGNVKPFQRLFSHLFAEEQFPLLWLAHLIQYPGIKMFVAIVVWSQAEGVGKNLLFETVGALFDRRHFKLIGQSEVDDDFCGWIPGAIFVVADEVRASKSDKSRDRLKLWQTATYLRTHDKNQPKREVENLMNMGFLSNHADGMFLSDQDRRFYVREIKSGPLPESIKQEFLVWRDNGGLSHLRHYLESVSLDGFDPKGRAPITESKREMIEASRSDLERWALDIVTGATPLGKEIATAEELTRRFTSEYTQLRTPPSVATVAKVLIRMGAVRRDNQVRLTDGRKVRALAIRRPDHWKQQPESAWREELEKRL